MYVSLYLVNFNVQSFQVLKGSGFCFIMFSNSQATRWQKLHQSMYILCILISHNFMTSSLKSNKTVHGEKKKTNKLRNIWVSWCEWILELDCRTVCADLVSPP